MSLYMDCLLEQKKDHSIKSYMPKDIEDFLIRNLPKVMLCSSSLKTDNPRSYPLEKYRALKHEHIQPNHENMLNFMIIDSDINSPDAYLDLPCPFPNMVVINPETGHCQLWYFLEKGVSRSFKSRRKCQDYYFKTLFKLTAIHNGDAAYNGTLARSPFNPKHICLYPRVKPYTLNELNQGMGVSKLDYEKDNPDKSEAFLLIQKYCLQNKQISETMGFGRNCTIFDILRVKAYKLHEKYVSETDFAFTLQGEVQEINQNYFPNNLLSDNELKHMAKSIARYCFKNMHYQESAPWFRERQKARGARGGEVRSSHYEGARKKCFDLYMQDPSLKATEIAQACGVSERTIRTYIKKIKEDQEPTVELIDYSAYTNKELATLLEVSVRTVQRKRVAAKLEAERALKRAYSHTG